MRKFTFLLPLLFMLVLSGCSQEEVKITFKIYRDDYFIYDDSVIIKYITNQDGVLESIDIDRLLSLEDIFYAYNLPRYEDFEPYLDEEIFVQTTPKCSKYGSIEVPFNISVGITRFRYNSTSCSYKEVDRNNDFRSGPFIREYKLTSTVPVSPSTAIKVLIFEPEELVPFKEIIHVNHTVKNMGLFSSMIDSSQDVKRYSYDIRLYEQFLLKYQNNLTAEEIIEGIPVNINLFNLDSLEEIKPLIENFNMLYEQEVNAISALYEDITVVKETTESEDDTE